jgi:hypothetical protein
MPQELCLVLAHTALCFLEQFEAEPVGQIWPPTNSQNYSTART